MVYMSLSEASLVYTQGSGQSGLHRETLSQTKNGLGLAPCWLGMPLVSQQESCAQKSPANRLYQKRKKEKRGGDREDRRI